MVLAAVVMVWYDMVLASVVMVWYGMVLASVVRYGSGSCGTVWFWLLW